MDDKESNILRNTAHEVIIRLMEANRVNALKLLRDHAAAAIEQIEHRQPAAD